MYCKIEMTKWHIPCFFSSLTDMSLKDWDVKEQEGLREVEKILDRADEILEVRDATFE